jgi:hypothetical protein
VRQRIAWILWPAFLAAIPATGLVFSYVDPLEVLWLWGRNDGGRLAVYTLGFLFFWALGAVSSALTCLLQFSPYELNRCTLEPQERPEGCPKRELGGCHQ